MYSSAKEEHFDLFTKPKFHEVRSASGSEDTGMYKKYKHNVVTLDYVVEYFKFEERKRRGFSSPYLTKNPYEGSFSDYVEELEKKYAELPAALSHERVISALEEKYKKAMASLI
jgi:hypothetical protein